MPAKTTQPSKTKGPSKTTESKTSYAKSGTTATATAAGRIVAPGNLQPASYPSEYQKTPTVQARGYCAQKQPIERPLPPATTSDRARAIIVGRSKWLNGTVLHYYFFGSGDGSPAEWTVPDQQRTAIRKAFAAWKGLGLGLSFTEVDDMTEAEIRIAFDESDGSWSYVGRDILEPPQNDRTMNFGWDLTDAYGGTTALHEIGHTLGMPHEHQNPYAGIVWNEEAVYDFLGGPPNNWPRETTFNNVLRKLNATDVTGSQWDWKSVMEYDFPAGLIIEPAAFSGGVHPPGGLSDLDKQYMLSWYPGTDDASLPVLEPFVSAAASLAPGQQMDFAINPPATRMYTIATFGASDTVLGLFEKVGGELKFLNGDDDSGDDTNAELRLKLQAGKQYVVRLRCYYSQKSATTAVMYW
jgi:hypothetical protein